MQLSSTWLPLHLHLGDFWDLLCCCWECFAWITIGDHKISRDGRINSLSSICYPIKPSLLQLANKRIFTWVSVIQVSLWQVDEDLETKVTENMETTQKKTLKRLDNESDPGWIGKAAVPWLQLGGPVCWRKQWWGGWGVEPDNHQSSLWQTQQ